MTRRSTDGLDQRQSIRALSLPGLIRLVSEIADNGPINRRRGSLQAAFGNLTANQLGHAIDRARDFGLVYGDDHERVRYRLTDSGEDLADVYDTAARWARTHQFPTATSDFVTRVQHTLTLLGQGPALAPGVARLGNSGGLLLPGGAVLSPEAISALDGSQAALTAWLQANVRVRHDIALHTTRTADEMERAA
ncbi:MULTISPECIES: hypothetical protein [unclassified Streptomyces]|uniref:hypothetical protein n=1 Tax=unclassified Streptomyces TaxID=2593676 RepID=UPI000823AB8B|nr:MULTISPECIES: hypothetical protein [unclassified Streptomyces]MYT96585.1 hypothetical protein [Streptomyces sp. SID8350]SCK54022.1 hypothetical protein YUWDRAFT_04790 [Streptomyces sp. AmelKG-D3]